MNTPYEKRVVEERVVRDDLDPSDPRYSGPTTTLRRTEYLPPRRRWAGVLAACAIGGVIGAYAVSTFYDDRTLGQKIDATVATAHETVKQGAEDLRVGASSAARDGATVTDKATAALGDAGITAAVKTALAADPALSALKIDVTTDGGVVSLDGPAPDERARERAEVIAAAPEGVVRVDNRLIVPGATQVR